MTATAALTTDLQKQVLLLEDDLRERLEADPALKGRWVGEHLAAIERGRTASPWITWRDDRVTQAAAGWVLTTVFVRFCEDNGLVAPVWIAGPEHRRQEALDAQLAYFRREPEHTDREWLMQAVTHLAGMPATAELVGNHASLWLVAPSGQAASQLLAFWRRRGDDGALVYDFVDHGLDTRFLGDLYQDLSAYARTTFALLQTPVFVEEFILDCTMEPAFADRPLQGFRVIDPTCGSGHFLLGMFDRLLDRWQRQEPATERQALVQRALDGVHGVDLNPFAVAIAVFRLTIAALKACELESLERAPAFQFHLAVGDSLLHGNDQIGLDLGAGYEIDAVLSGFAYATEDLEALRGILRDGTYDVVVGNPPYIQVADRNLNLAYRSRYPSCKGTYAMTVPFMEKFFALARDGKGNEPAGWVGQITSNSFMQRRFGSKLIEQFLSKKDLRLVVDTSGAYIPGHGTPTVIIVGRNRSPVGSTVRTVLGTRGEPGRPSDPAQGIVWKSLVGHVGQSDWSDRWVTVLDMPRSRLSKHPWSLSGGGAHELLAVLDAHPEKLGSRFVRSGMFGDSHAEELLAAPRRTFARLGVSDADVVTAINGDVIRDWMAGTSGELILPPGPVEQPEPQPSTMQAMWPWRTTAWSRATFQSGTYREAGRHFLSWHQVSVRDVDRRRLVFAKIATHNQFAFCADRRVEKPSALRVELPVRASEEEHLELLGVLNSSAVCFWLKQNSYPKGGDPVGDDGARVSQQPWSDRYEFTGTTLQSCPLPAALPHERGRLLNTLARELAADSAESLAALRVPTSDAMTAAAAKSTQLRRRMISVQEELDWEVYGLYGLGGEDLTYRGADLPELSLGERAFEIYLARMLAAREVEESTWFSRHGSTPISELPARWPEGYRDLVQRRLDRIESEPSIRMLETPEYKRRWAHEPWEVLQERALRGWLLDRLEDRKFWFDGQGRPTPRSVASLADGVERDVDLRSVLALWDGRPDESATASLGRLLADEAVPYLAAYRYKDTGLRKREAWEQTWALQRREDAGVKVGVIPVPPKYTSVDFRKGSYWQARGKLDVPKERFVLYPDAGRETDPTPLLGWAGWDHAQQSLALSLVIGEREAEGWEDDRLVPLVAGLAELQPWVVQWHSDVDPTYGVSLAAFCREQLEARAAQVGMTSSELAQWRPAASTRGRKSKVTS